MNHSTTPLAQPLECLVVDDEPRLRQVLMHMMRHEGFRCFEAADGIAALELLEKQPVTLVMSDMRMPRMEGIELLGEIRKRWPDIAVVMVTAVADVDVAVRCLAQGAMDYLTKPFHLEEVRARVRQALEKRQLILENRDYQQHLESRVAQQAKRIEELFLGGIQALAEALEVKDPYTRGHSVRVSQYSACIARILNLSDEVVRQIELGGHVHDIGKIGVQEAILNKADRLTEEEYRHIMTHPVVGWRILSPLLGDAPIALNVVRSHHERFDGKGLPDGLAGEDIPIEARIAAIADSFDAMTSGRPYRQVGYDMQRALRELEKGSGQQFDVRVVQATLEAANSGAFRMVGRRTEARARVLVQDV